MLEEMLVIQPHEGGNHVELKLCSIENLELHGTQKYSGFAVEHVEIRLVDPQGKYSKHAPPSSPYFQVAISKSVNF